MNPATHGARPAPFEVEAIDHDHGVKILALKGELDLSTAPQLDGPLDSAVSVDGASVLVNLSDCEFIDSTGIALLVRAWQRVQSNGAGGFAVCCAKQQVQRVLEISGVGSSIPLFDDIDGALAQLNGSSGRL